VAYERVKATYKSRGRAIFSCCRKLGEVSTLQGGIVRLVFSIKERQNLNPENNNKKGTSN
jgi:hypothetical protein